MFRSKELIAAFIMVIVFFVLPCEALADYEWKWENPKPQGNSFSDVWGSSGNDVFAVGLSGAILHYDGSEWSEMHSDATAHINSIWGSSGSDVFAVTNDNILHYDGSEWSIMNTELPGGNYQFEEIWGSSGNDVFIVGNYGQIVHYNGSTWSEMVSNVSVGLSGIWGTSGSDVFAVGGDGTIIHYDGSSWSIMRTGTKFLYDVWGSSGNDVFAVGLSGTVLHYDGNDWTKIYTGTTNRIYGVWGTSGNDVYAVSYSSYQSAILHYDGSSWSEISSGSNSLHDYNSIWGSSGSDVFTVGRHGAISHFDGNTWALMTNGSRNELRGVWGFSNSDIYVVGAGGTILHNNGISWTEMPSGTSEYLNGVWGPSNTDIFATGSNGVILRCDGSSWTSMTSGTNNELYAVWGNSVSDVYAVGSSGTILHYDGVTWSSMTSNTTERLRGVWGTSQNNVYAVGDNGTILHYEGNSWSIQTVDSNELHAIWGSSGTDIFVTSSNGRIWHYNGTIWDYNYSSSSSYGVWGRDSNDVHVVGLSGLILHYDGVSWDRCGIIFDKSLKAVWGSANQVFAVGSYGTILNYRDSDLQPPIVSITAPADGVSVSEDDNPVGFTATAQGAVDGDISGNIRWSSNIDGQFTSPAALSVGTHSISAIATDSGGLSGIDTITVIITPHVNIAPVVNISVPGDEATYSAKEGAITFAATAIDPEDGDITGSINWSSDIDGAFTSPFALSDGEHVVTASATDSGGLNGTDSITVTITPYVNIAPSISITSPANGAISSENDGAVTFTANAQDPEDGDLSSGISWSSDIDGNFSPPAVLSVGLHTITARVSDSDGASDTDSITVTMVAGTDHFEITAIPSPQHVETPFQVTVTALTKSGAVDSYYNKSFYLNGVAEKALNRVLITECGDASPDFVEIQNTGSNIADTQGWFVALNNAFQSNINDVHNRVWYLPEFMPEGEILYKTDYTSDNYWGENIWWAESNKKGWVLLVDGQGKVRDFYVWGYSDPEIINMNVNAGGYTITGTDLIDGDQWIGSTVVYSGDPSWSFQRSGFSDSNVSDDFSRAKTTKGLLNKGLIIPFEPYGLFGILLSPQTTVNFASGVWSGNITVHEKAVAMMIEVRDEQGIIAVSNQFDVEFNACDINGDGKISLTDTVLALKIISGEEPLNVIPKEADLDGDGKIGMVEVIYSLQKISEIR